MHESFSENGTVKGRMIEATSTDIAESVLEYYIESDDDLVGLLAYALYEKQKRDWMIAYRRRNSGRTPGEAEIAAVTSNYLSADLRSTLRDRAAQVLSSYAETYVQALESQIRISAISSEALRQARDLEDNVRRRNGFWRQVRVGFAVTALVALLFVAAMVTAVLFGPDIVEALRQLSAPGMRT